MYLHRLYSRQKALELFVPAASEQAVHIPQADTAQGIAGIEDIVDIEGKQGRAGMVDREDTVGNLRYALPLCFSVKVRSRYRQK